MSARNLALKAIYRTNEENAFSNLIIDNLLTAADLDRRDRRLVTHLVYGSLRWRNSLDWIINQVADRKVTNMTPWVRNALRLGVYQLEYLDRIPARAACNETVEAVKKHSNRGAVKYVNAVLRNIVRRLEEIEYPDYEKNPVQHLRYQYSQPQWLIERWRRHYGAEITKEICSTLNQIPLVVGRTNTLQVTREQLITNLAQEGVTADRLKLIPEAVKLIDFSAIRELSSFQQGQFMVQGLSSMLAAPLLAPAPGETVVDLCSAPGGKTTHLAQLMKNQGQVHAVDKSQAKLDLVAENCRRLGVENVSTHCQDGRTVSLTEPVDKVLVDAPCSGLGIMANKPEIKWQKSPQNIEELADLQVELLANGLSLLPAGGELLYTVCTFTPEETEQVIERLHGLQEFSLADLSSIAAEYGLTEFTTGKTIKILPVTGQWEGFFMCKLIKE